MSKTGQTEHTLRSNDVGNGTIPGQNNSRWNGQINWRRDRLTNVWTRNAYSDTDYHETAALGL